MLFFFFIPSLSEFDYSVYILMNKTMNETGGDPSRREDGRELKKRISEKMD